MRKIEHPDSTTIVLETKYHLLKADEIKNTFIGVEYNDVKIHERLMDVESLQPQVAFAIGGSLRYVANIGDLHDAGEKGEVPRDIIKNLLLDARRHNKWRVTYD